MRRVFRMPVAIALSIICAAGCARSNMDGLSRWPRSCINRSTWQIADDARPSVVSQLMDDYSNNPYLDLQYTLEFEHVLAKPGSEMRLYMFRMSGVSDIEIAYMLDRFDRIASRHVISPYMLEKDMSSCL